MSKLGEKRQCAKCGAKFYDFGADPIKCPKCGHQWSAKSDKPAKKAKKIEPVKPKKVVKPKLDDDELPVDLPEVEDEGELEPLEDDDVEVQSLEEIGEHEEEEENDPNSDDADDDMFLEEELPEDAIVDNLEDYIERDEDEEDEDEDSDEDEEDDDEDEDDEPRRKKKKKKKK
jgi:uncharacterized protein (TIGR02300 family)